MACAILFERGRWGATKTTTWTAYDDAPNTTLLFSGDSVKLPIPFLYSTNTQITARAHGAQLISDLRLENIPNVIRDFAQQPACQSSSFPAAIRYAAPRLDSEVSPLSLDFSYFPTIAAVVRFFESYQLLMAHAQ
jgi:hypothetical protein